MENGWIKLHRKVLNNPVIMKDADHLAIWTYILLKATHTEKDVLFNGKRHTLQTGEFTTGRNVIAAELNLRTASGQLNRSKVERVLKLFENEHQIEQRTDRQCRLIKVLKWNSYQIVSHDVSNVRATSEPRVSTKQEGKKERIKEVRTSVRFETETLYDTIQKACDDYKLQNKVNIKSLDVYVERYIGKIRLGVEFKNCLAWLIDKNLKVINSQRIGNWFKKALEIQKRDELKQLEWKTAQNDPAYKAKLKQNKKVPQDLKSLQVLLEKEHEK